MDPLATFAICLFAAVVALGLKGTPAGPRGRPLLSCYTLVVGLFGVYYLMPGALLLTVTGGRYIWLPNYGGIGAVATTAFVAAGALLLYIGGYGLRTRGINATPAALEAAPAPISNSILATQVAWGLVGLGVILKMYVIVTSGGLEMTILRQSGGVTESMRLDQVSPLLAQIWFLSSIADAGVCWLLICKLQQGKSFWGMVALFVFVTALSFLGTGKRLYALWPLVTAGLAFHFYLRPLRLSLLPVGVALGLGLGFGSLLFRIYAPASLANVNIDLYRVPWAEGSLLRFYFMSLEFASFELLTLAIDNSAAIVYQFGGTWDAFVTTNIEPFAYFIPRALWAGKPELMLDLSHANRVVMFGGALDDSFGVASMLPGTSWTFGGPLGMAFAFGGLGWFTAGLDKVHRIANPPSLRKLITYAFLVTATFHIFRQGTIAWTAMILIVQQLGMLIGFAILLVFDGRSRAPQPRSRPRRVGNMIERRPGAVD